MVAAVCNRADRLAGRAFGNFGAGKETGLVGSMPCDPATGDLTGAGWLHGRRDLTAGARVDTLLLHDVQAGCLALHRPMGD